MSEGNKNTQAQSLVISEDWKIHYDYGAGEVASRFLRGLAEKKTEGTKCPHCGLVALPPRGYCERCFVKADEWVTVGQEGVLEAATIVMSKFQKPAGPAVRSRLLSPGRGPHGNGELPPHGSRRRGSRGSQAQSGSPYQGLFS